MAEGSSLKRTTDEYIELVGLWDIGASGAHTKNSKCSGLRSVTRNAAGKYTVGFDRPVFRGDLISMDVYHIPVAGTGPLNMRPTKAAYTRENLTTIASQDYEAWSVGATPAQTEVPSGDQVWMRVKIRNSRTS
jgi:hypothetical protein